MFNLNHQTWDGYEDVRIFKTTAEASKLIVYTLMMSFTDFNQSNESSFKVGWWVIGFMGLNMLCHVVIIIHGHYAQSAKNFKFYEQIKWSFKSK